MRFLVLFLTLTCFTNNLFALFAHDSLLIELKNTSENKEKTLLLNELSKSFKDSNLDSSFSYARKGFDLATEIKYALGIAENAGSLADYYIINDSLNKAKEYYFIAIKQFEDLDMKYDQAQVLMVLGNIYLAQSNYSEALMYYQKSLYLSEENNFTTVLPNIYNNTGIIYSSLGEKDRALEYYMKAYSGFKTLDLKEDLARVVSNIAAIHRYKSMDSKANDYYNEALKIFLETGNLIDASYIYVELGNFEFNKENYLAALEYFQDGYDMMKNQEIDYRGPKSRAIANVMGSLGSVYFRLGNKLEAIEYLEKSLALSQQNNYLNTLQFSADELSQLYEGENNFKEALKYYKIFKQYNDSIYSESSIRKITQLEMQYEFDKNIRKRELEEARKETVRQRKDFFYLLSVSLGVFIAVVAFLMYLYQRSKTAKIELKRQNLRLEHEKLQQELEYKNRELATNVMYLLSKNEFITSTAEKLTKAKISFKKENQKIIQDVIRDLLLNSSKDVWKEFELRFQEVHSEFYQNLNKKFPDLTPNEKKICAFLRLNMSTKDISAITYQSVRSIDMARFRLRKKLELDSDDNLITFLSHL